MSAYLSDTEVSPMIEGEGLSDLSDGGETSSIEADSSSSEEEVEIDPSEYSYLDSPADYSMFEDEVVRGPETLLYWNLEQYPIPESANLVLIHRNIKLALHLMGIHGALDIFAYGAKLSPKDFDQLYKARVYHRLPTGAHMSIAGQICVDILLSAESRYGDRTAFVVLGEQNPEFDELKRVLHILQSRYQNAALIVDLPPGDVPSLFLSADSVFRCTQFVHGGITRPRVPRSKIIQPLREDASAVFWDTAHCPFPVGWSGHTVFHKIKSALAEEFRVSRNMSITAYVDEEKKQSWGGFRWKKTRGSRIEFHPGGNKAARHERMLHDLLLSIVHHEIRSDLVIVSGKVRKENFDVLELLQSIGFSVFIVTPTEDTAPESPEWPTMLLDQSYYFGCPPESETESSCGSRSPEHNKLKAGD